MLLRLLRRSFAAVVIAIAVPPAVADRWPYRWFWFRSSSRPSTDATGADSAGGCSASSSTSARSVALQANPSQRSLALRAGRRMRGAWRKVCRPMACEASWRLLCQRAAACRHAAVSTRHGAGVGSLWAPYAGNRQWEFSRVGDGDSGLQATRTDLPRGLVQRPPPTPGRDVHAHPSHTHHGRRLLIHRCGHRPKAPPSTDSIPRDAPALRFASGPSLRARAKVSAEPHAPNNGYRLLAPVRLGRGAAAAGGVRPSSVCALPHGSRGRHAIPAPIPGARGGACIRGPSPGC